jgi:hypothetical protein
LATVGWLWAVTNLLRNRCEIVEINSDAPRRPRGEVMQMVALRMRSGCAAPVLFIRVLGQRWREVQVPAGREVANGESFGDPDELDLYRVLAGRGVAAASGLSSLIDGFTEGVNRHSPHRSVRYP